VGVFQPVMDVRSLRFFPLVALVGALAFTPAVAAQQPPQASDAAARTTARQLALEGVAAHNRGDWATVVDRFERAEQLFHAPIHLRYLALGYERMTPANVIRAAETWQRLGQEQLGADAPQQFRDAIAEARRELERLEGRLGHISIELAPGLQGASVTLDGQAQPATTLATLRFIEAGSHTLRAEIAGHPAVERQVNIGPGATERVLLDLPPPVVEVPVAVVPRTTTVLRANPLRTVGFVTAGVGGAALLGGVIAGLMASSEYDSLVGACPNMRCSTQSQLNRRDSVDSLASTSTALFVSGGVLAAAGVVMILVGRPREETVQVAVGPRHVGLSFSF
jgi:hypothetical protein